MEGSAEFLITIGAILLLGLLTTSLAQRTFLPRVTLLLLFGALIGRQGLDLIPPLFSSHFEVVAQMTLLMVGFLLGSKLTLESLRDSAGEVLWISLCAALLTTLTVSLGLALLGVSAQIAILLGTIASATAPAAILDVVEESHSQSRFSRLLLSIVALDDVWALALFGVGLALVKTLNGADAGTDSDGGSAFLTLAAWELGGAVILGVVIGLPAAYLTGRLKQGQPMLTEALGIVFICGGLALWLEVSYLIATIVMGAVIANTARHHDYPFHAIEGIEAPFLFIFFVLAGASLELGALLDIGIIGAGYLLCRVLGKYFGARVGCRLSGASNTTGHWMGLALLPQAGVAIGMALVASGQFPEYRQLLLSVVISSTVLFEIIGPVFTRQALSHTR